MGKNALLILAVIVLSALVAYCILLAAGATTPKASVGNGTVSYGLDTDLPAPHYYTGSISAP